MTMDTNRATLCEGGRLARWELEELVAGGFNHGYETGGRGSGYQGENGKLAEELKKLEELS